MANTISDFSQTFGREEGPHVMRVHSFKAVAHHHAACVPVLDRVGCAGVGAAHGVSAQACSLNSQSANELVEFLSKAVVGIDLANNAVFVVVNDLAHEGVPVFGQEHPAAVCGVFGVGSMGHPLLNGFNGNWPQGEPAQLFGFWAYPIQERPIKIDDVDGKFGQKTRRAAPIQSQQNHREHRASATDGFSCGSNNNVLALFWGEHGSAIFCIAQSLVPADGLLGLSSEGFMVIQGLFNQPVLETPAEHSTDLVEIAIERVHTKLFGKMLPEQLKRGHWVLPLGNDSGSIQVGDGRLLSDPVKEVSHAGQADVAEFANLDFAKAESGLSEGSVSVGQFLARDGESTRNLLNSGPSAGTQVFSDKQPGSKRSLSGWIFVPSTKVKELFAAIDTARRIPLAVIMRVQRKGWGWLAGLDSFARGRRLRHDATPFSYLSRLSIVRYLFGIFKGRLVVQYGCRGCVESNCDIFVSDASVNISTRSSIGQSIGLRNQQRHPTTGLLASKTGFANPTSPLKSLTNARLVVVDNGHLEHRWFSPIRVVARLSFIFAASASLTLDQSHNLEDQSAMNGLQIAEGGGQVITRIPNASPEARRRQRLLAKTFDRLCIERGPWCELKFSPHCNGRAEGLHHVKKKSAIGSDDPSNLLLSCNTCNVAVEDHPAKAREAGLVLRSWEVSSPLSRAGGEPREESAAPSLFPQEVA